MFHEPQRSSRSLDRLRVVDPGQGPDPLLEAIQGAGALLRGLGQLGDLVLQKLAASTDTGLDRPCGDARDLGDLCGAAVLPVVELEHDLVVEWDVSQRSQEQALLLLAPEHRRGAGGKLGRGRHPGIEREFGSTAPPQVVPKGVVGDAEQEGTHACIAAEAVRRLEAAEEGALHEIFGCFGYLAQKEAEDARVVAMKQGRARMLIARLPRPQ